MRALALLFIVAATAAWSCAARLDSSTRLSVGDLRAIASQTTAALAASEWLSGRDGATPPVVIAVQRVENLSSDVIPEGEQWYLVRKVAAAVTRELGPSRSVTMVLPAERVAQARAEGDEDAARLGADREPTHVMTATFRSATRSRSALTLGGAARKDAYFIEYSVVELATGAIAWTGAVEFERTAAGRSYQ